MTNIKAPRPGKTNHVRGIEAYGHRYIQATYPNDQEIYWIDGKRIDCTHTDTCTCGDCDTFLPSLFK